VDCFYRVRLTDEPCAYVPQTQVMRSSSLDRATGAARAGTFVSGRATHTETAVRPWGTANRYDDSVRPRRAAGDKTLFTGYAGAIETLLAGKTTGVPAH
jgi:hypothetical protein